MCVACRARKEKEELLKIVKNKDDSIAIDEKGKLNGRGAYVCNNNECIAKCIKTKSFNRSFKGNVPIEIYDNLKEKTTNE